MPFNLSAPSKKEKKKFIFCKHFLLVCILSSHSLNSVFCRTKVLNFNQVQLMLLLLYLKAITELKITLICFLYYLLEVL